MVLLVLVPPVGLVGEEIEEEGEPTLRGVQPGARHLKHIKQDRTKGPGASASLRPQP